MSRFRKAFLAAGRTLLDQGEISPWDMTRLRLLTMRPSGLAVIEAECCEHCVRMGALAADAPQAAVNWESLISLIMEFIKLLLDSLM